MEMDYNGEAFVDFTDAAAMFPTGRGNIIRAVNMHVFSTIRPGGEYGKKYIPVWEIEAVKNMPGGCIVGSLKTADYLRELRRERNKAASATATDKDYNVDGTPDYISKSELSEILKAQGIQLERILATTQQLVNLIMKWSELMAPVFESTGKPQNAETIDEWTEEWEEYLRQKSTDPNTPIPPSIQKNLNALSGLSSEAWSAIGQMAAVGISLEQSGQLQLTGAEEKNT
jgi:hypothetical protein